MTNEWLTKALRLRGVSLSDNTVNGWLRLNGSKKCFHGHIDMMTEILEERVRLYEARKVKQVSNLPRNRVVIPREKLAFYLDFVKQKRRKITDISLAQLAARAEVNECSIYNWRRFVKTAPIGQLKLLFETIEATYPLVATKWRLLSAESGFEDVRCTDEEAE